MSSSDNFLKVGSCDSGGTTRTLTVNTNSDAVKDDQFLSLREALLKTQQEPGCWNIVFKKSKSSAYPPSKTNDPNYLGLGYWTIRLSDSLPAISRSNIRINYDDPKTITLVPNYSKQNGNNREYQLKKLSGNRGSGSMLNVGEMDIKLLENKNNNLSSVGDPRVAINKFNFINNTAQGGSGGSGGGGGFGAGGGISVFSGKLKVENSVFQNLGAKGGPSIKSKCGASSGKNARATGWYKGTEATGGANAATGGLFSAGIGTAGHGGRGGSAGIRTKTQNDGGDGSPGGKGQYGSGGGGGGGGGGRSFYEYYFVPQSEYNYRAGKSITLYAPRSAFGSHGYGGRGGLGGAYAGHGAGGVLRCDGHGAQDGSARGAAIAVHDIHTAYNTPNAELFLSNVNLVGNNRISGHTTDPADIWLAGNKNIAWLNNVKYASTYNHNLVDWQNTKSEVISGGTAESLAIDSTQKPFYFGYSSPVNQKQAKRSYEWDVLDFTKGTFDSAIVRFEQPSSGLKAINADLSDLKRVTDELWKEQLPDNSTAIIEKYNSQILQAETGALEGILTNQLEGLSSLHPAAAVSFPIAQELVGLARTVYEAEQERDEAIEQNKKDQKKLQQKLQQNIDIQFSPIDLRETRSAVVIENFTIGEDQVTFQGLPAGIITTEMGDIIGDPEGRMAVEIHAKPINQHNFPTKIAELRLDPASLESHNISDEYFLKLIHTSKQPNEMILSGYSKIEIVDYDNFVAPGPANTPVIVDRSESIDYYQDKENWRIKTSRGNDQVYATDGWETIYTEAGDDIIYPRFGNDNINTGSGFDWIKYDNGPVNLTATIDGNNEIVVKAENKFSFLEDNLSSANTQIPSIKDAKISDDGLHVSINFNEILSKKLPNSQQFSILSNYKFIPVKGISIDKNSLNIELQKAISENTHFYLSYIDISEADDINAIQNANGVDFGGFSLTNAIDQKKWENKREITLNKHLSSNIKDAEKFTIISGSSADFSSYRQLPHLPISSDIRSGITLETGPGTDIIGSEGDDLFTISFMEDDINSNLYKGCTTTTIKGGSGTDRLELLLPKGGYFLNQPNPNSTNVGNIQVFVPNLGVTTIAYEGIEKFGSEGGIHPLYFKPKNKYNLCCGVPFAKILKAVSPNVVRLNIPGQKPDYLGSSQPTESLSSKHLDRKYTSYYCIQDNPSAHPKCGYKMPEYLGYADSSGKMIQKPAPLINRYWASWGLKTTDSNDVQNLINAGSVEDGLYRGRSETVIITINSDENDQSINFLDDIMTVEEAYELLYHYQLNADDKVELWDARISEEKPTFITSYDNLRSARKIRTNFTGVPYPTPYEKAKTLNNQNTTSVDTSSACLNNNNNQPTTKIAYAGLNQKLSSEENSENKQLNGRSNQINTMGQITTPPKRLGKKIYLFNDIKVRVGEDNDKNNKAIPVRLDKTQTITNFNSEVDTIILPAGTDIRDVAITDKTIYFKQKAIASFKGSVHPKYLQNDVIDDSGVAEQLYSRESGEKLFFYVYDGDKSNVNLKRQGGDVSLHVKAPNKRLNQWYDSFFNTLDYHIEADFIRTLNPRKADLKIYNATEKNFKGKTNVGTESYGEIFGLADSTRLVKGKTVNIVVPIDSLQKGNNWSNSWNQSENIHSSLQDIGRALGLRHPMGNANSILFNTNDTVMSDVKLKDGNTIFFTRHDINALKDIWMDEGSHGKEKPSYNLFVPETTSKDIDFRLKGKGINSGLGQTDEAETAVGTFKLKGSQFKNVPRGWIAANSSQHDVILGFDSNKNGVAEPDEAFAIFSIDQSNDPIRGDRHMEKIFDQLSNPNHQGLLSIQPSRLHFDPDHVGNKSGNSGSEQTEVIPFFVFKHSEQFKNNDFAIDVKFNGIPLSEMKIPSTLASSGTIKPNKDMGYGDSYNYLLDQITESALLG